MSVKDLRDATNRERLRFAEDLVKYPESDQGVYRGFTWLMRRPHGSFWCGYVDLRPAQDFLDADPEHFDELESRTHYGFTGAFGVMSGFDCAHADDFTGVGDGLLADATYKDHDYVLTHIQSMIDYLADNGPKMES